MKYWLPVIAVLVTLGGCSTIENRTTQFLEIDTVEVEDVDCYLVTAKHKYRIVAPGKTRVERSPYNMTISCYKANYLTAIVELPVEKNVAYDELLVGHATGMTVDRLSNAIYEYPSPVVIDMKPVKLVHRPGFAEWTEPLIDEEGMDETDVSMPVIDADEADEIFNELLLKELRDHSEEQRMVVPE